MGAWVPLYAHGTSGLPLTWKGHLGPDASSSPRPACDSTPALTACTCSPDKGHLTVGSKVLQAAPWLCCVRGHTS